MKRFDFLTSEDIQRAVMLTKGATIITVVAETAPRMRKTDNPYFGRVKKVAVVNGMINYNYEGNVNRQREREGSETDFRASAPAWGERVGDSCIIECKGRRYLDFRLLNTLEVKYICDGKEVAKAEIEKFLPSRKKNASQGLDKVVKVCRYALDSIRELHFNRQIIKAV